QSQSAQEIAASAQELETAMGQVSEVVEQNTAMAQEMAGSSIEVSRAVENIAAISQENSASAQEVSSAAEEMSAQVEEVAALAATLQQLAQALHTQVARFHLPEIDADAGRDLEAEQLVAPMGEELGNGAAHNGTNGRLLPDSTGTEAHPVA